MRFCWCTKPIGAGPWGHDGHFGLVLRRAEVPGLPGGRNASPGMPPPPLLRYGGSAPFSPVRGLCPGTLGQVRDEDRVGARPVVPGEVHPNGAAPRALVRVG